MRLWDMASGRESHCFGGHGAGSVVASVAWTPDGRQALSGGWDRTVRLWDLEKRQEVRRTDFPAPILRIHVAADGRRALFGATDGAVRLQEIATGKELRLFEGHGSALWGVAFTPAGRQALVGGGRDFHEGGEGPPSSVLRVWDVENGREVRRLEGHRDGVRSVAISPDGRRALTGSLDGTLRLWDLATGRELHCFEGHTGGVECVAFSPDGRGAASASFDKTVRLWKVPRE
jgi:WD40 repeat protein